MSSDELRFFLLLNLYKNYYVSWYNLSQCPVNYSYTIWSTYVILFYTISTITTAQLSVDAQ